MGGGLAGRCPTLKPMMGGAIATHLQERFVANCSELKDRHSELENRHCERSNPSFRMRGDNGLLRFARNDVASTEYDSAFSRRIAPEVCKSFAQKRAQGMPGACCTRGLVCKM